MTYVEKLEINLMFSPTFVDFLKKKYQLQRFHE